MDELKETVYRQTRGLIFSKLEWLHAMGMVKTSFMSENTPYNGQFYGCSISVEDNSHDNNRLIAGDNTVVHFLTVTNSKEYIKDPSKFDTSTIYSLDNY